MHDKRLYVLKKMKFHAKMNLVSVNEDDILSLESILECKMAVFVGENIKYMMIHFFWV